MTAFRNAVATFGGLGALMLAPAAVQAADYQVYRDAVCAPNAECGINFAPVPAGKVMRISNFSCYLRFGINNDVGAAQLVLLNANGSRAMAITPNLLYQDGFALGQNTEEVFVSNETVRVVGRPGQRFRAYAQVYSSNDGTLGTISQLSCHISGTLS
jgi:hypothetical protein